MKTPKPKAVAFHFAGPLPAGSVIVLKGYEYEVTETRPHTRRDGDATDIMTWKAHCIECGVEFEQTTGRSFSTFKRRCEDDRTAFMIARDKRNGDA